MIFNMIAMGAGSGGGGLDNAYAIILVSYPAGSVLTCTDGSTTLTASNTAGAWAFGVPTAGNWTISCTDGTNTASSVVTITTSAQTEYITLVYDLILFDASGFNVAFTNVHGATIGANTITNTTLSDNFGARTSNKLNFSTMGKRYLSIIYSVTNYTSYRYPFNLVVTDGTSIDNYINAVESAAPTNAIKYTRAAYPPTTNQDLTLTLDVSNITGEHYAGVGTYGYSITLKKMYLHN